MKNHLTLERSFCPIGQGGFSVEQFKDNENPVFTAVFDCGTESSSSNLTREIDRLSRAGMKQVDVLFVSHFHADHVNGIKYLMKKTLIKRIVIPKLPHSVINIMRIQNMIRFAGQNNEIYDVETDDDIVDHFRALENAIFRESKIIPIDIDSEKVFTLTFDNERLDLLEGEIQNDSNAFWEYRLFSPICKWKDKADEIEQYLRQGGYLLGNRLNTNKILNDIDEIKKEYNLVFNGKDNEYSMVVMSSIISNNYAHLNFRGSRREDLLYYLRHISDFNDFYRFYEFSSCIYFGDFDTKLSLHDFLPIMSSWRYGDVCVIQIPHHGAAHNFDRLFLVGIPKLCIIAAGTRNRYKHPCYWVVRDIEDSGSVPRIVSEQERDLLTICYDISF